MRINLHVTIAAQFIKGHSLPYIKKTFFTALSLLSMCILWAQAQPAKFPSNLTIDNLGNPFSSQYNQSNRKAANVWDMQRLSDGSRVYLGSGDSQYNSGSCQRLYINTSNDALVNEGTFNTHMMQYIQLADNGDLVFHNVDAVDNQDRGPGYIRKASTGNWQFLQNQTSIHFDWLYSYKQWLFSKPNVYTKSTNGGSSWTSLSVGSNAFQAPRAFKFNNKLYMGGCFWPWFSDNYKLKVLNESNGTFSNTSKGRQQLFPDDNWGSIHQAYQIGNRLVYIGDSAAARQYEANRQKRLVYYLNTSLNTTVVTLPNRGIAEDLTPGDGKLHLLTNLEYRVGNPVRARSTTQQLGLKDYWEPKNTSGAFGGKYTRWEPPYNSQQSSLEANDYYFQFGAYIENSGNHKIELKWPNVSGLTDNLTVKVRTKNGTVLQPVINQTVNAGTWVNLGTVNIDAADVLEVRLIGSTGSRERVAADVVRVTHLASGNSFTIDDRQHKYYAEILTSTNGSTWTKVAGFNLNNMARSFEYVNGNYYVAQGCRPFDRLTSPASEVGVIYKLSGIGGGSSGGGDFFRVENKAHDKWLKGNGSTANGDGAAWNAFVASKSNTGDATRWKEISATSPWVRLENKSRDRWLRGSKATDNPPKNGYLVTKTSTGDATRWKFIDIGGGYFRLQQKEQGIWLKANGNTDRPAPDGDAWNVFLAPTSNTGDSTKWKKISAP